MASDASRGKIALDKSDYPSAIMFLTAALDSTEGPTKSPLWLIQRSIAYQRTSQFSLALADAEAAHHSAVARGRRELIATAHFRRAVSYHGLGQYGNSRMCFNWTRKFNEKERGLGLWQAKVALDYEKAGGEGAECNKVTAKEIPDKRDVSAPTLKKIEKLDGQVQAVKKAAGETYDMEDSTVPLVAPKVSFKPNAAKVRTEWYQSATQVTIELLWKGLKEADVRVEFEPCNLLVTFPMQDPASSSGESVLYQYDAKNLAGVIVTDKCDYRVTTHKVEITLVKQNPGYKWDKVFYGPITLPADKNLPESEPAVVPPVGSTQNKLPNPSSTPAKNWDKVLKAEEDEDEGGDPMNSFFQKLYKDADPDTKRAMMKSYQESNGTALSTSWSDVGSKTIQTQAPDGMEAKKWGA